MQENEYLLVRASTLPEVFVRVLEAKELLASGGAKNISKAAQMVGISRSAFYKYKDSVFRAGAGRETVTLTATLLDQTGALQTLLAGISASGAGVVTINQSIPENGAAAVAVTIRTGEMHKGIGETLEMLRRQPTVRDIRQSE